MIGFQSQHEVIPVRGPGGANGQDANLDCHQNISSREALNLQGPHGAGVLQIADPHEVDRSLDATEHRG
jgi:hypothetical protein